MVRQLIPDSISIVGMTWVLKRLTHAPSAIEARVTHKVFNNLVLGDRIVLEVRNNSNTSRFRATARITNSYVLGDHVSGHEPFFTMAWDDSSQESVEIMQGDMRSITVATHLVLAKRNPPQIPLSLYGLRFRKVTNTGLENLDRGQWWPDMNSARNPPVVEVEIVINADREPGSVFRQTFRINVIRPGEITFESI